MARRDESGGRSARRKPLPVGRSVKDEFASLCLGDARRTARFKFTIGTLAQAPQKSLPDALPGWAALKAAFGLPRSDSVDHALGAEAFVTTQAKGTPAALAILPIAWARFCPCRTRALLEPVVMLIPRGSLNSARANAAIRGLGRSRGR